MKWIPPGPVAQGFVDDRSFFSAIMGPMGSAKTSSCIQKLVKISCEQKPSLITGEREVKFGVIRDTLANMKRTTYKSIKQWFPKSGAWGGGGSSEEPPFFKAGFQLQDGTIARLHLDFVGLDEHNIEDIAKGWELTGYWLNEADLLSKDIKTYVDARVGRFPGALHGGCSWYGGIADYNAPDTENYLYEMLEEQKPEGHKLFKQPSGFSPNAENMKNLPEGYYTRMAIGKEKWWVRRNIENNYGFSREGEPVFEQYNDEFHCGGRTLEAVRGIQIVCYADAALRPAMVFTQTMANGQKRILSEIYINGGAKQLGEAALEHLGKFYPGLSFRGGTVDPAADKRSENDSEAENYIETLNRAMNLSGADRFRPAPTNDPTKRQDAVKHYLTTMVGSAEPALLVSARAIVARKGFNSTYRFKKRANGQTEDKPEKLHPVSDVHDAIQYFALDDGGYEIVSATESRQARRAGNHMRQAKMAVTV